MFKGLTDEEVKKSHAAYGKNETPKGDKYSFFKKFLENLKDPIIKILLGAMLINIVFSVSSGGFEEAIGIGIAVFISTFVSTASEYSSNKAFRRLSEGDVSHFTVIRGGNEKKIKKDEVAVGDILFISVGDIVPADGILVSGSIFTDQSSLTGESVEIEKNPEYRYLKSGMKELHDEYISPDMSHAVFSGSKVSSGEGFIIICRVGGETEYGKVASHLTEETPESPLKNRLKVLANEISFIGYVAAGMVAVAYLFNSFFIEGSAGTLVITEKIKDLPFIVSHLTGALTLAVSVIVVAVPEGLPMMITIVLSSNMKKMLKKGVLVKRMIGIETAGSLSLLFTDKTGTITSGKMRVCEIVPAENSSPDFYEKLFALASLNCVTKNNPTDEALEKYYKSKKVKYSASVISRLPFNSSIRLSGSYLNFNGEGISVIKGAPEVIFSMCGNIPDSIINEWKKQSSSSMRTIAVAFSNDNIIPELSHGGSVKLTLAGIAAIKDEIRREVPDAVRRAHEAGIGVVMVTGDNSLTAKAIAGEVGIINSKRNIVITGEELADLNDGEIEELLPRLAVVARALPRDKIRLVKLARKIGYVAGMTGDGINDAPALKGADVGFAMGSGSDVSKEAADIVLTKNSFATICDAVLFGRTIFRSIRKFIVFQLTMNLAATGISFIGPFIGIEHPVTIVQMLWVNIIMDTLGAIAFAGEPALKRYMKAPPISRDEKIFNGKMVFQTLYTGILLLAMSVFFLKSQFFSELFSGHGNVYYLTVFFSFFVFAGIFTSFTVRTSRKNILSGLFKNKTFLLVMMLVCIVQLTLVYFGGDLFRTCPISTKDMLISAAYASLIIPLDFIRKLMFNRNTNT